MLSLRRLKAIVLLVAVMAAGFVLFDTFLVQETAAQSGTTECDILYVRCDVYIGYAWYVCNIYATPQSDACVTAIQMAVEGCRPYYTQCEN